MISTVAGTGVPGYSGDGGPATTAQLNGPVAVSAAEDGSILIADRGNAQIRRVDTQGRITTISSLNQLSNGSAEFTVSNGEIPGWVQARGTWHVSLEPGAPEGIAFFATADVEAELTQDASLERFASGIDAGLTLFRLQALANAPAGSATVVLEYRDENGVVLDAFDSGALGPQDFWQFVEDIRVPPAGTRSASVRLLASPSGSGDEVGFDGLELAPFDGSTELAWPEGVTAGDESVFASDSELNVIIEFLDPTSRILAGGGAPFDDLGDGLKATEARLQLPAGLAFAPDGSVLVADSAHDRVRRIDPGGKITTIAGAGVPGYSGDGSSALEATLSFPRGVAADSSGNVFIADTYNHCIRRVGADGNIETVAGTGEAGYSGDGGDAKLATLAAPEAIAVGRDGSLYVADTGNNAVRKVALNGSLMTITTIAGGPDALGGDGLARAALLVDPSGVWVVNDDDDSLLVVERGAHRVRRIANAWPGFRFRESIVLPAEDGASQFVFDPSGRHLRTGLSPSGPVLRSFEYDDENRLTSILDGGRTTFSRDPSGTKIDASTPSGLAARMTFNSKGRVIRVGLRDVAFEYRVESEDGSERDELQRLRFLANPPSASSWNAVDLSLLVGAQLSAFRKELGFSGPDDVPELTLTSSSVLWFAPNRSQGDLSESIRRPTAVVNFDQTYRGVRVTRARVTGRITDLGLTTLEGSPVPALRVREKIDELLSAGLREESAFFADLQVRCSVYDPASIESEGVTFDQALRRLTRVIYCGGSAYIYDAVTGELLVTTSIAVSHSPTFEYHSDYVPLTVEQRGGKQAISPNQWFRTGSNDGPMPYNGPTEVLSALVDRKLASASRCDYRLSVNYQDPFPNSIYEGSQYPFPVTGVDAYRAEVVTNELCSIPFGLQHLHDVMFEAQNAHYQITTAAAHAAWQPRMKLFAWAWMPPSAWGSEPRDVPPLSVNVSSSATDCPDATSDGCFDWRLNEITLLPAHSYKRTVAPLHEYGHFLQHSFFGIARDAWHNGCESKGVQEGLANAFALEFADFRVDPRTLWPWQIGRLFREGPGQGITGGGAWVQARDRGNRVQVGGCSSSPYYDGMPIVQVMWKLLLNRLCLRSPCEANPSRVSGSVSDQQVAEVARAAFTVAMANVTDGWGYSVEEFLEEMLRETALWERWAFPTDEDWIRLLAVFDQHGVDISPYL